LSWLTILKKRDHFREAFEGFDPERVAGFTTRDVTRLLKNTGIVRHRGKIESTINNARRALEIIEERGSLAKYFWGWEPPPKERPEICSYEVLRGTSTTPASVRLSKDLKARGWTFVGPTTVYAFMQAMGLVNDHIEGCPCRPEVQKMRRR
jgi:DNA-3-methyladenine glycosylase I